LDPSLGEHEEPGRLGTGACRRNGATEVARQGHARRGGETDGDAERAGCELDLERPGEHLRGYGSECQQVSGDRQLDWRSTLGPARDHEVDGYAYDRRKGEGDEQPAPGCHERNPSMSGK